MLVLAAVAPSAMDILLAAIIVLLLAGLIVARLLAALRQEGRSARQQSLASLAALLHAPDKAARLYALNLLASFPLLEISALEAPLRDMFKDPEAEVRAAASRLLGLLHPPEQLLRQLASRQLEDKLQAIEGLAALSTHKAFSALLETAARAAEETVRQAAKAALARAESAEAFSFLISALAGADPILASAAREALHAAGTRALAPLLTTLRDPRKTVRAKAAELLGDLALQEGQEALVSALSDPVDEVRAHAAHALGMLPAPNPAILAGLAEAFSDASNGVREEAAFSLARFGDQAALVPVLDFLCRRQGASLSPPRQAAVIRFIAKSFPTEAAALAAWDSLLEAAGDGFFASLAAIMEEAYQNTRSNWIDPLPTLAREAKATLRRLLARLGQAGLREPFRAAIYDRNPGKAPVRAEVARLLGEIGGAGFGEDVFALLSDPEAGVRKEAAWAAGRIAHFAPVDGLCQALSDPDAEVRVEAARSLSHIVSRAREAEISAPAAGGDLVRPAGPAVYGMTGLLEEVGAGLLQAVNDPVNTVRAEVARALGFSRVSAAIPSLAAWALGDESAQVREAAAEALSQMSPADVLPLVAEALSYKEPAARAEAARLLGRLRHPAAVPHLIRSLQDEAGEVREKAGRALWEIGASGQADALLLHLQSPDPRIRASVAGLLGKVQAAEALDGLAHALRDPNEYVRAAVVNALARFGGEARRHLPALLERMEDPDDFVRARAVNAALAVGGEQAAATLARAAADPEPGVRAEAVGALIQLALQGSPAPLVSVLSDPAARAATGAAFGRAEPGMLRLLLAAMRQASTEVQVALLSLLTETMRSFGSVEGYQQDLTSVDTEVRSAALEALSLFGTEEAAAVVAAVLQNDPAPVVRRQAALVLGRMPGEQAQAALHRAARQDLDPEVKETARQQLRISG